MKYFIQYYAYGYNRNYLNSHMVPNVIFTA